MFLEDISKDVNVHIDFQHELMIATTLTQLMK